MIESLADEWAQECLDSIVLRAGLLLAMDEVCVKEVAYRSIFAAVQLVQAAKKDKAIATILVEGGLIDKLERASIERKTNAGIG